MSQRRARLSLVILAIAVVVLVAGIIYVLPIIKVSGGPTSAYLTAQPGIVATALAQTALAQP